MLFTALQPPSPLHFRARVSFGPSSSLLGRDIPLLVSLRFRMDRGAASRTDGGGEGGREEGRDYFYGLHTVARNCQLANVQQQDINPGLLAKAFPGFVLQRFGKMLPAAAVRHTKLV